MNDFFVYAGLICYGAIASSHIKYISILIKCEFRLILYVFVVVLIFLLLLSLLLLWWLLLSLILLLLLFFSHCCYYCIHQRNVNDILPLCSIWWRQLTAFILLYVITISLQTSPLHLSSHNWFYYLFVCKCVCVW